MARIRTIAFALCSFTAGLAVVVYASRLGSLSVGFDGGTYVLYAVAAAVIGGASLFGGHGKPIHPLLGGLVIATVINGLALLNISTAGKDIATSLSSSSPWPSTPWCGAEVRPASRRSAAGAGIGCEPTRHRGGAQHVMVV